MIYVCALYVPYNINRYICIYIYVYIFFGEWRPPKLDIKYVKLCQLISTSKINPPTLGLDYFPQGQDLPIQSQDMESMHRLCRNDMWTYAICVMLHLRSFGFQVWNAFLKAPNS